MQNRLSWFLVLMIALSIGAGCAQIQSKIKDIKLSDLKFWEKFQSQKGEGPTAPIVSGAPPLSHKVRSGETLSQIAMDYYGTYKKYNVLNTLRKYNRLRRASDLTVGQVLKIPRIQGVPFIHQQRGEVAQKGKKKPSSPQKPADIAEKPSKDADTEVALSKTQADQALKQGKTLIAQKKFQQAIALLKPAHQADPTDPGLRDALSEAYFGQGMNLFKKNRYLKASQAFEQAADYGKGCKKCLRYRRESMEAYKDCHYKAGIGFFENEQLEKAIAAWEKVRAVDPDYKSVQDNIKTARNLLDKLNQLKQE